EPETGRGLLDPPAPVAWAQSPPALEPTSRRPAPPLANGSPLELSTTSVMSFGAAPAAPPVPAPSLAPLVTPAGPAQPAVQVLTTAPPSAREIAEHEPAPAITHVIAGAPAPAALAPLSAVLPQPLTPAQRPAPQPVVAPAPVAVPSAAAGPPAPDVAVRVGAEDTSDDAAFLSNLLVYVLDHKSSDLHLTVGAHPTVRQNGHLFQLEDFPVLTPPVIQKTMYAIMSQKQREKFEEELELDFAYSLPGKARFRVNLYKQRDAVGAAFRLIPYEIKKLEDLGVPPAVANFAMLPRGFVLVTGPTGSGKSTTLASVVDLANRNRRDHIMTVEDPIEFLHSHKGCLVNQREVGEDTWSFKNALKHVLRQDPDIILVGEMRDLETIEIALTAAETGHLVMATLHTQDAAQTIDRVIDVFPPSQQQQVRVMLSGALQGVVCQQLVKTADGKGRVVAAEVMVATPAIRNLIREGKTHQIYSALQAGAKHGMSTMDSNLAALVKRGTITYDAALEKCHHVDDFKRLCGRV
ncbi:MAG: twitching motility protein, partial [Frankiales bacterium]|nr:twitching motility protein [Frankiales bacterium]